MENTLPSHCASCIGKIKKHCQFRLSCTEDNVYEFNDMSEERYKNHGNCCSQCSVAAGDGAKHRNIEENENLVKSVQSQLN